MANPPSRTAAPPARGAADANNAQPPQSRGPVAGPPATRAPATRAPVAASGGAAAAMAITEGASLKAEDRLRTLADVKAGFEPREGDVLVVSYGGVKLNLPGKYNGVEVGGNIYTRRLREGDDPMQEYVRIYGFLANVSEESAREKIRRWSDEVKARIARGEGGA